MNLGSLSLGSLLSLVLFTGVFVGEAQASDLFRAEVVSTEPAECGALYDRATVEFDGTQEVVELGPSPFGTASYLFCAGDTIIVERLGSGSLTYRDVSRTTGFFVLLGFLVILALVISRQRGMWSTLSLGLSTGGLMLIVLPQLASGASVPLWATLTLVGLGTVGYTIAHGPTRNTALALVATGATLLVAFFVGLVATSLLQMGGAGSEYAFLWFSDPDSVEIAWGQVYLFGMLLGALGVLDDITTSQVALMSQLKREPDLSPEELMRRGMQVGHTHVASLMNTLVYVYVAAALPMLLYVLREEAPWWYVLSSEIVLEELVRMVVGSMALLLAVPLTTFLGLWTRPAQEGDRAPCGHVHEH